MRRYPTIFLERLMFRDGPPGPAIGDAVRLDDGASFAIALDADAIIRLYDADQFLRHMRWKINLCAIIEQQPIHFPMRIHQILPDGAFGSRTCPPESIDGGSLQRRPIRPRRRVRSNRLRGCR